VSKSYPYNVILTKDPTVIDRLFFDKITGVTSFSSKLSSLTSEEREESFIVSPLSNRNFLSLDVNFPQGDPKSKFVVLKLLETSELLEYFSITTESFQEALNCKAKVNLALRGGADELLVDNILKGARPRFYLSYGIGDDTSEWAGPFTLELIDANISITSDGIRELELMFSPTLNTLEVFTNKSFNDYQYAQSDSIFDTRFNDEVVIATKKKYKLSENKEANEPAENFDSIVRDLISSYISDRFTTVPRGNVLVLIPDGIKSIMDTIGKISTVSRFSKPLINSRYGHCLGKLGIDINVSWPKLYPPEKTKKELTQITEKIIENKSSEIKNLNNKIKELKEDYKVQQKKFFDATTSERENFYEKRANSLLRRISKLEESVKDRKGQIKVAGLPPPKPVPLDIGLGPFETKSLTELAEKERDRLSQGYSSNPEELQTSFYDISELTHFVLSMGGVIDETNKNDSKNVLNSLKPLYTFAKCLSDFGDLPNDFTIFEENDMRVVKLLKESKLIKDETSPVVIFGRSAFIKHSIYPSPSEKSVFGVERYGVKPSDNPLVNRNSKTLYNSEFPNKDYDPDYGEKLLKRNEVIGVYGTEGGVNRMELADQRQKLQNYIKTFQEAFKVKYSIRTSSFNEGMGPYSSPIKELTKDKDDPVVFTHNVTNSNVLSLSFDSSPYKGQLLSYQAESSYRLLDEVFGNSGQILGSQSLNTGPMADYINYISTTLASSRLSSSNNYGKTVLSTIKKAMSTEVAGRLYLKIPEESRGISDKTFLDLVIIKASTKSSKKLKSISGGRLKSEAEILKNINKYIINVDIKTLPFFNIPCHLGRQCVLFGKPNTIIGSNDLREKVSVVDAFYTNSYKIVSYSHKISPSESSSSFKLMRDGTNSEAEISSNAFELFSKQLQESMDEVFSTDFVKNEKDRTVLNLLSINPAGPPTNENQERLIREKRNGLN